MQDPRLWYLNRRSVAGGAAVGGFFMFFPPLGQPLFAAAAAIRARVNLPVAVALALLTNPLTIPPLYYGSYWIGAHLLDRPPIAFRVEFWMDYHNWLDVLAPLFLGNLLCAAACGTIGYFMVQTLWRWRLRREIAERRRRLQRSVSATGVRQPSSIRRT